MTQNLSDIVQSSAKGGFYLFVGYFLYLLTSAICSIIVARLLGPEGYGLFILSLVIPNLIFAFMDPGVGAALTRFTAKFRGEGRNDLAAGVLKTVFLFKFPISVIASLLCFLFSDLLATYALNRPDIGLLLKFSSLMIFLLTSFNYLNDSFNGLERMEGTAIIYNTQSLVKTTLSAALLILGFGVFGALTSHIASFIAASFIGGFLFYRFYKVLGKPSNNNFLKNIKVMVSYGFPLYASGLLGAVLSQIQLILLAFFVSNSEIGNFNAATGLLTLVGVLTYPFTALFPAFSKLKRGSYELNSLFKLSVKYTAMLIVPVSLMISIISKDVVFTFYGRIYTSAPLFLSLYVLTNLYAGFGSVVVGHMINGIGETKLSLYSGLINMVVFLPLAYIFTQSYGIIGFVSAAIISSTCSFIYSLWAATTKIHVKFDLRASSKIYIASLISVIPVLVLVNTVQLYYRFLNLILYGSIFVFVYLTLLPIIRIIDRSDLENIKLLLTNFRIIQPIINPILKYEYKLLSVFSKEQ